LHPWRLSHAEAERVQRELAPRVVQRNEVGSVRTVAGVDVSIDENRGVARAAVVLLQYPELIVERAELAERPLTFPYIPGLLAFRELPAVLAAFEALCQQPDLIMVDGQGVAHPRRLGIASHLGLLLDVPSIGCAKSRLVGQEREVSAEAGAWSPLVDRGETVGAIVRTRPGTKPVYVSVGHKVDLPTAIRWVLACVRDHRLPEPLRQAHLVAGGKEPRVVKQEGDQLRLDL